MRIFWILIFLASLALTADAQQIAFEKGTRAANAGNYNKALKHYQKALAQAHPATEQSADFLVKIHYNLGVCFYHLQQPKIALEEYDKAIALSNGNYQKAFRGAAMAHVTLENWRSAKENFYQALRLNQNDGELWFDLALVFINEKDYPRAAAAFKESIVYGSAASSAAHNNLGVILALKNNLPAAEKEFETALLKSNGAFAEAQNNLEFCRARRENPSQNLMAKLHFSVKN